MTLRCISTKLDGDRCTRNATGTDRRCTQHVQWRESALANYRSPRLYELTQKELNGLAQKGIQVMPGQRFSYPDILDVKLIIQGKTPRRLKPSLKGKHTPPMRMKRSLAFNNKARATWMQAANAAQARALKQLHMSNAEFDLMENEFERHRQS